MEPGSGHFWKMRSAKCTTLHRELDFILNVFKKMRAAASREIVPIVSAARTLVDLVWLLACGSAAVTKRIGTAARSKA